ncbi:MAG: hypothetical protein J6Q34_06125 [Bacteroidales bacterium]|nr:hypothetical protein [Bacteroidales bacterium]
MTNNKKMLLWGSVAVLLLATATVFLFLNLSGNWKKGSFEVGEGKTSVYHGIPSDAVAVFDFKHFGDYCAMMSDTASFFYGMPDAGSGIVQLQEHFAGMEQLQSAPLVFSMHYSAKNSVSFLQVMSLAEGVAEQVAEGLQSKATSRRKYNGITVYSVCSDAVAAVYGNLFMASSSSYVLESSIRHLENNTSILDKREFEKLLKDNGVSSAVYINHNQIGKFFSGVVERRFLGHSDFVMKFASWSCLRMSFQPGKMILNGVLDNFSDEGRFSNVFGQQAVKKSLMGRILPASTLFAVSMPESNMHEYLKQHNLYLEMQKKTGSFAYRQKMAQGENGISPREWVDSLAIEELVSAYCKFGEKCEWVTVIREKQQFGLNNMISSVVDRDKAPEVEPFRYKGYLASVFGELFAHCSEEYFCRIGAWTVLGSKTVVEDFANGSATFFNLEDYMGQTPAKGDIHMESSLKLVANMKEAGDSVLQVFKPYYRGAFERQMAGRNFEFVTADLFFAEGEPQLRANLYSSRMERLPQPPERGEDDVMTFKIDSTVAVPAGPFEVKDATKKSAAYLEQLPNMRLRYMDANKKGVWAIPFETPLCGYVEQIDLYANGRLQMLFASEDKLYLLDRLGRFVRGYPAKLPKKVVLGPRLLKNVNGIRYSILVLNEDNTISWCDVSGKPVAGTVDIVAPEFVKELPEFLKLGGKRYWVLRAPSQLLLYTIDGKRVEMLDKKKKIDRSSDVTLLEGGNLKVKCTDGKEYSWNIATGKIKKL